MRIVQRTNVTHNKEVAMRTLISLFTTGVVLTQLASAHAATEVARFPAHNTFLSATSNDPVTGTTTSVSVTRELGQPGGPVYRLFYIVSNVDTGLFLLGSGLIDAQDFQVTPQQASLLVDVNTLTLDTQVGELPENGVIDVDWEGTGVQRESGSTFFEGENVRGIFVGTSVTNVADITGSVFGTPLVEPFGDIRILNSATIVITRD
jgi:hypothetical protein